MPSHSKYHDQRLFEAVKSNRPVEAKSALASGANPDQLDLTGEPLLHFCSRHHHIELLKFLLLFQADPNAVDKEGHSSIRRACKEGWLEPAKLILEAPSLNLTEKDEVQDSLLHNVAARGRKGSTYAPLAALLIAKGIPVSVRNERGETPLHHASRYGGVKMCQLLVSHGADIHIKDMDGFTPLHAATLGVDNDETVRFLLKQGASANERERNGQTPLHLLASVSKTRQFDLQKARHLIQAQANLWLKDIEGLTPFEKAQRGRAQKREIDTSVINLLRPKGPPPTNVVLEAPLFQMEKRKK